MRLGKVLSVGGDPVRLMPGVPEAEYRSDKDLQRAEGSARVIFSGSERGTRIVDLFERSPVRIMFPRAGGAALNEAVLVNTAGGIAGGDQLECSVKMLPKASIAVTSQAAEKVYRALNQPARITTTLNVCENAELAWLPQETILFNGGRLHRKTEIDVDPGARVLALEWLVLGRAAHGEHVDHGEVNDSWRVTRCGRLLWADNFRIADGTFGSLRRTALLAHCRAVGTIIYHGPDHGAHLAAFRECLRTLPCRCAATLVAGLIILRFAAESAFELKTALRTFLTHVTVELHGGPFRIPKMWSC